ncbi:hypothetical protein ACFWIN_24995 [Streptomyces sp. NPDC127049]|uniref:hypothetical protein n=1 Tax=Streptomyces sp. NPDC127049 TaxID=3347118 RepID=UPI0036667D12
MLPNIRPELCEQVAAILGLSAPQASSLFPVVGLVLDAVGEGLSLAVLVGAESGRLGLWIPVAA